MKKYILIILVGLMLSINSALAGKIMINVKDVDISRGGNISVMIFSENGFPKAHEQALLVQTKSANRKSIAFTFNLAAIDELAIKVHHDENMDGKVTKNWTGIYPKEGLGFSNKQKVGLTGPPVYKKSKLLKEQLKDGLAISVIYP